MAEKVKHSKKEIITHAKITIGAYGSAPGCINDGVVERIIEPPEGGTFLKFIGCDYLYKGTTDQKVIDVLYFPKRRLRNFISFLTTKWGTTLTLLTFPFKKPMLIFLAEQYLKDVYLESFTKYLFLSESKYCISVREIWRVMTLFIGQVKNERIQNILFKLRNIICMILEFDVAYRLMVQDILPNFNKQAVKENPGKEMERVLDIFYERTNDTRWKKIGKTGLFLLKVWLALRKLVVRFLLEIDLDKIKLDNADYYFCLQRPDYKFRGKSLEERLRQKRMIDRQKHHFIPSVEILKRA